MVTNPQKGKRKGGGRPTVVTEKVVGILRTAFSHDLTVEEACELAKISKDAYYERIKKDPKFADEMESAQLIPMIVAKQTVMKAIKDGNVNVALRFLERRQSERYGPTEVRQNEVNLPPRMTVILPGSHPHPRIIPQENIENGRITR